MIGRADLSPGLRAAQLGHGCIAWTVEYGVPPENLVLLEVPDEATLNRYWAALMVLEIGDARAMAFFEPDFDDELTAVAVTGSEVHKILSSLPLAMRDAV